MLMGDVFERLVDRAPLPMMARMLLERALDAEHVNELFERVAAEQYTRKVLFADIVTLMCCVVTRLHRSVHVAYHKYKGALSVSLAAIYDKLKGIEPAVSAELLRDNAVRLSEVIQELHVELTPLVPGYRTRIVDGNAFGATEHRLDVLRETTSGPLPGKALVVYDAECDLAIDMLPCEDGHAQERSLFGALLERIHAGELWIADRNFCTQAFLTGINERGSTFLIRRHASLPVTELDELVAAGTCESGEVFEQAVRVGSEEHGIVVRHIVLDLARATRDGDRKLSLLTSLPVQAADAATLAEQYRKRWRIESMFHDLTTTLRCEVKGLGYPRAALFAFTVAVLAANMLAAVRACMRAAHGLDVEEKLSTYALVDDLQGTFRVTEIVASEAEWACFSSVPLEEFLAMLIRCAKGIDIKRYPKAKTRPRKPKSPRAVSNDPPHVSTYRLLRQKQEKRSKTDKRMAA
jgi:IS4 transposase